MSEDKPNPSSATESRTGTLLAIGSTAAAILVGVTSIFTTVQAMRITQASAQQMLFENQLQTCLGFNALTARINQNHSDVLTAMEDFGTPATAAQTAALREALELNDDRYAELHQDYLKMSMLMPDDTVYQALDVHLESNNAAWEMLERGAVSGEGRGRIDKLADHQSALLSKVGDGCTEHVAQIVRGKGRIL